MEKRAADKDALEESIKKLSQLNLIYSGYKEDRLSYSLHPLTHQCVSTK